MPGFGWMVGKRRVLFTALIILVLALAIATTVPTYSFFSRTTTVSGNVISFGTWGPKPSVCKVCPCFGVSGICAWPVFLYGNNLSQVSSIKLVKGLTTVVAKKLWHIGDGFLYCVFDLRSVPGGSYDIVAKTASGQETVVYRGFKVIGPTGSGGSGLAAAAQATTTTVAEDPIKFKLAVRNDDPAYLVANVQGPLRARFVSASLLANGTRFDGSIEVVTRSGCRVKFARAGVPPGVYDLVLNRGDESSLLLENAFVAQAYVPPPCPVKLLAVQPGSGFQGQKVQMKVTGVRLDLANGIALVQGSRVIQPAVPVKATATRLTVTFDLAGVPPGPCDLYVSCIDGTQLVLRDCFTVVAPQVPAAAPQLSPQPTEQPAGQPATQPATPELPEPVIQGVTPNSCCTDTKVQFTVSGRDLRAGMKVKLVAGTTILTPEGTRLVSAARLECMFDMRGVAPGKYHLVIVDLDGSEHPFSGDIEVMPISRSVPDRVTSARDSAVNR